MEEKGKQTIRMEMNAALKEEFDIFHNKIAENAKSRNVNVFALSKMVATQISLAQQIVREERALSGESSYSLSPHGLNILQD